MNEATDLFKLFQKQTRLGNFDIAEFLLLKSIEIEPDADKYTCLGWFYGAMGGQEKRALHAFRQAIRQDPAYGDAYNELGALVLQIGRPTQAIKWFRKALKVGHCSKPHFALYNLALIFRDINRPERSKRYLNLALKIEPGFQTAHEFLSELAAG